MKAFVHMLPEGLFLGGRQGDLPNGTFRNFG